MLRLEIVESPRIAAVDSGDSTQIQEIFAALAHAWQHAGIRVGGVIEETNISAPGAVCSDLVLRDLADGAIYPISQKLGRGSRSCSLDSGGLASACASVERSVRSGCDLVVISKFGKQEAAGGGLVDAFAAAIDVDVPVLTSVSGRWRQHWLAFSGTLSEFVKPQPEAIETWCRSRVSAFRLRCVVRWTI